ncbi:hypothetical protein DSO57_1002187 [Entomophthora muscae]|uniref:Uncharacterized protein n=1 Tax=Entomophthora muscae TaxID=34485 RepID=A0ACC2T8S2_9FUNG|nr:hypothetical protein DSO57_1002187 [Entomophthora muscae]
MNSDENRTECHSFKNYCITRMKSIGAVINDISSLPIDQGTGWGSNSDQPGLQADSPDIQVSVAFAAQFLSNHLSINFFDEDSPVSLP